MKKVTGKKPDERDALIVRLRRHIAQLIGQERIVRKRSRGLETAAVVFASLVFRENMATAELIELLRQYCQETGKVFDRLTLFEVLKEAHCLDIQGVLKVTDKEREHLEFVERAKARWRRLSPGRIDPQDREHRRVLHEAGIDIYTYRG